MMYNVILQCVIGKVMVRGWRDWVDNAARATEQRAFTTNASTQHTWTTSQEQEFAHTHA